MPDSPDNSPRDARPPLTLICGAAGTGKTEYALARYLEDDGRALLVVASPPQADTLAAQIAARSEITQAEARLTTLSFRSLFGEWYQARPEDGYRTISRAFQRIVLAEITRTTIHRSDFLGRMLDAPGFVGAFAERLREWKLACLTPDALEAGSIAAQPLLDDEAFPKKTAELARLFRAYETFLKERRMRDEADCLQDVIRRVSERGEWSDAPNLVLIDGFFRFNRVQRELLAALANRRTPDGLPEIEVVVTLSCDPSRPLLFAAPQRTRETLDAEFAVRENLLSKCRAPRPPALRLLEARLFGNEFVSSIAAPSPLSLLPNLGEGINDISASPFSQAFLGEGGRGDEGGCLLFDAPNPYVEAEMTAREFRRIYDAGGYSWNDFGIILRTLGDYAPILSAVFERYEIPLGADGPERLDQNPLVKTVLHLLDILRDGWQRDDVLAFLKSSYTAPDKLAADGIRKAARASHVRFGRGEWLAFAAKQRGTPLAIAGEILRQIAECEDEWASERNDPMAYASGLRQAVQMFGLLEQAETGEPLRRNRDRKAWEEADEVLTAIAQMAALAGREAISFSEFCAALREGWASASALTSREGEMVQVMEPYESRERPLRVAAVMGLTERVFPRRVMEDPFLRDAERAALRQAAGVDLEEQRDRADDERLFFYLAVTAPTERLILSYPRSSDESDTLPSFYLDEVRAAFDTSDIPAAQGVALLRVVSRTLADVAPQPDESVSAADGLLSACADLFEPAEADERKAEAKQRRSFAYLAERLREEASATGGKAVRAVLDSRLLPRLPRLEDPRLRADFACRKSVYSVTELETHLRCPFQYLLRHVLRLRPEEDDGARAQGDLLHDVLRRYFRRRKKAQNAAPLPETAVLQGELRALLRETLADAPLDAPPYRARMMHRALHDALDGFAQRETVFSPKFQTAPAHFELAFGVDCGRSAIGDDEREFALESEGEREGNGEGERENGKPAYDPASVAEPLALTGPGNDAPVLLCGVMDRVDFDSTETRAVVLDYKMGRSPDYAAIAAGNSLQMPLYLLAMERLFGKVGAAACYDSAREDGRSRIYRTEHVNAKAFAPLLPRDSGENVKPHNREQFTNLIRQAETAAIGAARAIEAGRVEARSGDHCAACAYKDVCRSSAAQGHDGEKAQ